MFQDGEILTLISNWVPTYLL